ncbi:10398_t:CDS:2 [Funneliformis caledonium]|uniref:10398_t:CDS:1 n=1 Tax=Funneliformis caledonium TaxID=1117310 RepID=A0A9N9AQN3_9GLOM|nr:10398_t:CDS:2 [Funneliformis caledonium]
MPISSGICEDEEKVIGVSISKQMLADVSQRKFIFALVLVIQASIHNELMLIQEYVSQGFDLDQIFAFSESLSELSTSKVQ